ncbi:MAG: sigma-70 family RNA polymerase sigma factor [Ignavibacteriae bacterium]|nr:sigma-70 family RNA polymerase sigma factor [Ignavibacteriota bacterium]
MLNSEETELNNILDDDFPIIEKFKQGDERAFTELIQKHKDKVRNLVFLTLGDVDYVDDISQDVFINVYHKLKEFRFESKFTTWLYRITVNKCRDYLRKKKVRSIFVPIDDNDYEKRGKTDNDNFDLQKIVQKAILKLPDKLKTPLILRDIDGYSYQEIAEKLECEVGTIKSRIFRARETLKIILEPYKDEIRG